MKRYGPKDTSTLIDWSDSLSNKSSDPSQRPTEFHGAKDQFITPELTVEELSKALFEVSQTLQKTNQELLEAQQQQLDLLTNISHDLRSPICAVKSGIEYMIESDDLLPQERNQILKMMQKRIILIERMIHDIFLLSSLHSCNKKLELEPLSIGIILEEYYYSCEQDPRYQTSSLELQIPPAFPYTVKVDATLLVRVLDNLFNNALKYSNSPAYIQLSASIYHNDYILICVKDHGIGIGKEHIHKIFNHSYTVSDARTPSDTFGNGFGLAIAKSIVTLHGGSIWCESQEDIGSDFCFTIPIAN